MATEIERKFLIVGDAWRAQATTHRLMQGYLNRDPQRTVRIRRDDERAFITLKGPTTGASRSEFEYPIPAQDVDALLALCDGPLIEKLRHIVTFAGMRWEIDEFQGANAGLIVAEIELAREDQCFDKPAWIGQEVTGDPRYYNANLVAQPFSTWAR